MAEPQFSKRGDISLEESWSRRQTDTDKEVDTDTDRDMWSEDVVLEPGKQSTDRLEVLSSLCE